MRRFGQLLLGALLVLAGSGSLAQTPVEKTPPPREGAPPPAETGPSLSGARKDFESVKSLREFGADPKAEGSRLELPRLRSAPAPADTAPSKPLALPEPKRGSNWLVDAMNQRAETKSGRTDDQRPAGSTGRDEKAEEGAQPRSEADSDRRDRPAPANPFSQYMRGWISPQDLALLQPNLTAGRRPGELSAEFSKGETAVSSPEVALNSAGTSAGLAGHRGIAPREVGRHETRSNPYLESLNPPTTTPDPALRAPASAFPAAKTSPAVMGGVEPTIPPRSKTPDFVRPNNDDKYFKPLKRF